MVNVFIVNSLVHRANFVNAPSGEPTGIYIACAIKYFTQFVQQHSVGSIIAENPFAIGVIELLTDFIELLIRNFSCIVHN